MSNLQRAVLSVALVCIIKANSAQTGAPAQRSQPEFSITLSADKSIATVGSEVRVTAILTNTSSSKIAYGRSMGDRGEFDFTIDVHDDKGNIPPLTEYGRAAIKNETPVIIPFSGQSILGHGEAFKSQIIMTKLYNFNPGKYIIQVQRIEESSGRINKSNTVTVTVTP